VNFSSVDSLGKILAAEVVNRGAGYTSIPSLAVADASCLCQFQVGYQTLFITVISTPLLMMLLETVCRCPWCYGCMSYNSDSVGRKVGVFCKPLVRNKDPHLIRVLVFRVEMRLASGGVLIPKRAHGLKINPVIAKGAKVLKTFSVFRYILNLCQFYGLIFSISS
jgi:hypothetical protein